MLAAVVGSKLFASVPPTTMSVSAPASLNPSAVLRQRMIGIRS